MENFLKNCQNQKRKICVSHICGILYHLCGSKLPHTWYTIPHMCIPRKSLYCLSCILSHQIPSQHFLFKYQTNNEFFCWHNLTYESQQNLNYLQTTCFDIAQFNPHLIVKNGQLNLEHFLRNFQNTEGRM